MTIYSLITCYLTRFGKMRLQKEGALCIISHHHRRCCCCCFLFRLPVLFCLLFLCLFTAAGSSPQRRGRRSVFFWLTVSLTAILSLLLAPLFLSHELTSRNFFIASPRIIVTFADAGAVVATAATTFTLVGPHPFNAAITDMAYEFAITAGSGGGANYATSAARCEALTVVGHDGASVGRYTMGAPFMPSVQTEVRNFLSSPMAVSDVWLDGTDAGSEGRWRFTNGIWAGFVFYDHSRTPAAARCTRGAASCFWDTTDASAPIAGTNDNNYRAQRARDGAWNDRAGSASFSHALCYRTRCHIKLNCQIPFPNRQFLGVVGYIGSGCRCITTRTATLSISYPKLSSSRTLTRTILRTVTRSHSDFSSTNSHSGGGGEEGTKGSLTLDPTRSVTITAASLSHLRSKGTRTRSTTLSGSLPTPTSAVTPSAASPRRTLSLSLLETSSRRTGSASRTASGPTGTHAVTATGPTLSSSNLLLTFSRTHYPSLTQQRSPSSLLTVTSSSSYTPSSSTVTHNTMERSRTPTPIPLLEEEEGPPLIDIEDAPLTEDCPTATLSFFENRTVFGGGAAANTSSEASSSSSSSSSPPSSSTVPTFMLVPVSSTAITDSLIREGTLVIVATLVTHNVSFIRPQLLIDLHSTASTADPRSLPSLFDDSKMKCQLYPSERVSVVMAGGSCGAATTTIATTTAVPPSSPPSILGTTPTTTTPPPSPSPTYGCGSYSYTAVRRVSCQFPPTPKYSLSGQEVLRAYVPTTGTNRICPAAKWAAGAPFTIKPSSVPLTVQAIAATVTVAMTVTTTVMMVIGDGTSVEMQALILLLSCAVAPSTDIDSVEVVRYFMSPLFGPRADYVVLINAAMVAGCFVLQYMLYRCVLFYRTRRAIRLASEKGFTSADDEAAIRELVRLPTAAYTLFPSLTLVVAQVLYMGVAAATIALIRDVAMMPDGGDDGGASSSSAAAPAAASPAAANFLMMPAATTAGFDRTTLQRRSAVAIAVGLVYIIGLPLLFVYWLRGRSVVGIHFKRYYWGSLRAGGRDGVGRTAYTDGYSDGDADDDGYYGRGRPRRASSSSFARSTKEKEWRPYWVSRRDRQRFAITASDGQSQSATDRLIETGLRINSSDKGRGCCCMPSLLLSLLLPRGVWLSHVYASPFSAVLGATGAGCELWGAAFPFAMAVVYSVVLVVGPPLFNEAEALYILTAMVGVVAIVIVVMVSPFRAPAQALLTCLAFVALSAVAVSQILVLRFGGLASSSSMRGGGGSSAPISRLVYTDRYSQALEGDADSSSSSSVMSSDDLPPTWPSTLKTASVFLTIIIVLLRTVHTTLLLWVDGRVARRAREARIAAEDAAAADLGVDLYKALPFASPLTAAAAGDDEAAMSRLQLSPPPPPHNKNLLLSAASPSPASSLIPRTLVNLREDFLKTKKRTKKGTSHQKGSSPYSSSLIKRGDTSPLWAVSGGTDRRYLKGPDGDYDDDDDDYGDAAAGGTCNGKGPSNPLLHLGPIVGRLSLRRYVEAFNPSLSLTVERLFGDDDDGDAPAAPAIIGIPYLDALMAGSRDGAGAVGGGDTIASDALAWIARSLLPLSLFSLVSSRCRGGGGQRCCRRRWYLYEVGAGYRLREEKVGDCDCERCDLRSDGGCNYDDGDDDGDDDDEGRLRLYSPRGTSSLPTSPSTVTIANSPHRPTARGGAAVLAMPELKYATTTPPAAFLLPQASPSMTMLSQSQHHRQRAPSHASSYYYNNSNSTNNNIIIRDGCDVLEFTGIDQMVGIHQGHHHQQDDTDTLKNAMTTSISQQLPSVVVCHTHPVNNGEGGGNLSLQSPQLLGASPTPAGAPLQRRSGGREEGMWAGMGPLPSPTALGANGGGLIGVDRRDTAAYDEDPRGGGGRGRGEEEEDEDGVLALTRFAAFGNFNNSHNNNNTNNNSGGDDHPHHHRHHHHHAAGMQQYYAAATDDFTLSSSAYQRHRSSPAGGVVGGGGMGGLFSPSPYSGPFLLADASAQHPSAANIQHPVAYNNSSSAITVHGHRVRAFSVGSGVIVGSGDDADLLPLPPHSGVAVSPLRRGPHQQAVLPSSATPPIGVRRRSAVVAAEGGGDADHHHHHLFAHDDASPLVHFAHALSPLPPSLLATRGGGGVDVRGGGGVLLVGDGARTPPLLLDFSINGAPPTPGTYALQRKEEEHARHHPMLVPTTRQPSAATTARGGGNNGGGAINAAADLECSEYPLAEEEEDAGRNINHAGAAEREAEEEEDCDDADADELVHYQSDAADFPPVRCLDDSHRHGGGGAHGDHQPPPSRSSSSSSLLPPSSSPTGHQPTSSISNSGAHHHTTNAAASGNGEGDGRDRPSGHAARKPPSHSSFHAASSLPSGAGGPSSYDYSGGGSASSSLYAPAASASVAPKAMPPLAHYPLSLAISAAGGGSSSVSNTNSRCAFHHHSDSVEHEGHHDDDDGDDDDALPPPPINDSFSGLVDAAIVSTIATAAATATSSSTGRGRRGWRGGGSGFGCTNTTANTTAPPSCSIVGFGIGSSSLHARPHRSPLVTILPTTPPFLKRSSIIPPPPPRIADDGSGGRNDAEDSNPQHRHEEGGGPFVARSSSVNQRVYLMSASRSQSREEGQGAGQRRGGRFSSSSAQQAAGGPPPSSPSISPSVAAFVGRGSGEGPPRGRRSSLSHSASSTGFVSVLSGSASASSSSSSHDDDCSDDGGQRQRCHSVNKRVASLHFSSRTSSQRVARVPSIASGGGSARGGGVRVGVGVGGSVGSSGAAFGRRSTVANNSNVHGNVEGASMDHGSVAVNGPPSRSPRSRSHDETSVDAPPLRRESIRRHHSSAAFARLQQFKQKKQHTEEK